MLPLDGRVDAGRVRAAADALAAAGVSAYLDDGSGSVGRRYARADELGTPFAVTVDFGGAEDGCVTLRERDSTAQLRLPPREAAAAVRELCAGAAAWDTLAARWPAESARGASS